MTNCERCQLGISEENKYGEEKAQYNFTMGGTSVRAEVDGFIAH